MVQSGGCEHSSAQFCMNCVLNPAFIKKCAYVDVRANTLSLSLSLPGDLICGALISLIHKQHMDGGVEEYGERMAGDRRPRDGQTETTPLLPAHNTSTDTHPSISPPGNVKGQNRVKPTGRGSCLRHGHVRVGRPNKRFPGRRSSQTVARQYGQLNITVRA